MFSPGEYIYRQNNIDDESIYYLEKGRIDISLENQNGESIFLNQIKKK